MARIVGGIMSSHVPAIGRAIAHDLQADPAEFECLVPKSGKQKFQIFKPELSPNEQVLS